MKNKHRFHYRFNMPLNSLPKKTIFSILVGLLPVLLFAIILMAPIPYSVSRPSFRYSLLNFLVILGLYYLSFRLSFRLKAQFDWLAGACLTALLFGMGLSYLWASGYSNDMLIAGVLPFKDGFYYYYGARILSDGQLLAANSFQSAWRPLYPGFISSLLLITRYNLQLVIALQLGLLGVCTYASATLVRRTLGEIAAALYMTFLYFYIQPMEGLLYTELLGLATGCLGLIFLLKAALTKKLSSLVVGLVVLMAAVSVRAGTFFIFPMLALWAGWIFRKNKFFSFGVFAISVLAVLVAFLAFNFVYNSIVVEPEIEANGNFAFTIYGQVVGGAGYNAAVQKFGRNNPERAYRAAWRFFQDHPLSFFIGAAKAYRDFFLAGIFSYFSPAGRRWWDAALTICALAATVGGLFQSIRKVRMPVHSLVLAGFIGIFLSIPFLPPRDGGVRFYASSVPFFFLLPAITFGSGLYRFRWEKYGFPLKTGEPESVGPGGKAHKPVDIGLERFALILSTVLLGLTVLVPILQRVNRNEVEFEIPSCPANQSPFAVQVDAGSFVDLVPGEPPACGRAPDICLSDFQTNSDIQDLSDQLVYQSLIQPVQKSGRSLRVFPARERLEGTFGLFSGDAANLGDLSNHSLITGCATRLVIPKRPDIYRIESFSQP